MVDNNLFEKLPSVASLEGWPELLEIIAANYGGGFAYGNNLSVHAIRAILSGGLFRIAGGVTGR